MSKRIKLLAIMTVVGLVGGSVLMASPAPAASSRLSAVLTGEEEVPGPGDSDGIGKANILLDEEKSRVCFQLRWRNIGSPTAAHIHEGEDGVAGGVVVELFSQATPLPATINGVRGCATGVDPALIQAIAADPAGYYVNIHNSDFPSGAIRGQLSES